ncbi:hypothetical protein HDU82_009084 [Entophlyctis luteolus]|nr:hypothetical protein HDU82_009084 [Entophlyctis luteolus]
MLLPLVATILLTVAADVLVALGPHSDPSHAQAMRLGRREGDGGTTLTAEQAQEISFNSTNAIYVVVCVIGVLVCTMYFASIGETDFVGTSLVANGDQICNEGAQFAFAGQPEYESTGLLVNVKKFEYKMRQGVVTGLSETANKDSTAKVASASEMRSVVALAVALVALLAAAVHARPVVPLARRQEVAATVTATASASVAAVTAVAAVPSTSAVVESTSSEAVAATTASSDDAETTGSGDESDGESALTQDQLNKISRNSLNAIYVMVALVAIMVGCVFLSSNSADDDEDGVSEVPLLKEVLYASGGKPRYDKDGTLLGIQPISWNVDHAANLTADSNAMENATLEEIQKNLTEAMNRLSGR